MRLKNQYYAQSNPPRIYVDYSSLVPVAARPFFKKYWDTVAADFSKQGYNLKEIKVKTDTLISRAIEIWAGYKLEPGSRIKKDLRSITDIHEADIMNAVSEAIIENTTSTPTSTATEQTKRTPTSWPKQQPLPQSMQIARQHYTHASNRVKAIFDWNYRKKLGKYPKPVANDIINDAYSYWLSQLQANSITENDLDDDQLEDAISQIVNSMRAKHRIHHEAIAEQKSEGKEIGDKPTILEAEGQKIGSGFSYPYLPEAIRSAQEQKDTLLSWDQPISGQELFTETLAPKLIQPDVRLELNRKIVMLHRGIPDVIPNQPDKWVNKTYNITEKDGTKTERMVLSKAMHDLGKYHMYQDVSRPCPTCRSIARMFRGEGLTPEFINEVITYWVLTRDSESESGR